MSVRFGAAQVTIPLGLDGAAHLFVEPVNGDDDNSTEGERDGN